MEAQVAQLAIVTVGDMKAWAEEELVRVRDALVVAKEARLEAEAEASRLEIEWTSLLLDIEPAKDEVSSLQS